MVDAQLYAHVEQKVVQDSRFRVGNFFTAAQRIPSVEGYAKCLKSNNISNTYYKIFFRPNLALTSRLGVIAAKKLMHKAIDRNTNKRAIREVFRRHAIKLKNLDIVVLIRRTSKGTLAEQRIELAKLFDSLEARCG